MGVPGYPPQKALNPKRRSKFFDRSRPKTGPFIWFQFVWKTLNMDAWCFGFFNCWSRIGNFCNGFLQACVYHHLDNEVVFHFPAFFVVLVKHRILSTKMFTRRRKYLYAALFIFAMILTPDGGFPLGNLMIWVPMVLLMEIGVYLLAATRKKGKQCLVNGSQKSQPADSVEHLSQMIQYSVLSGENRRNECRRTAQTRALISRQPIQNSE